MKIVILDGYTSNPGDLNWDKLKILGDLTVYEYTKNQTENVVERLQDCEIALTNKTVITKEIMEACPKLRYIGVLATGYNVVDMKAAAERGITVTNVPGYSTQAVAQQAFALLLEICSHVAHHSSEVHSGRWSRGRDFCFWDYPLVELDQACGEGIWHAGHHLRFACDGGRESHRRVRGERTASAGVGRDLSCVSAQ